MKYAAAKKACSLLSRKQPAAADVRLFGVVADDASNAILVNTNTRFLLTSLAHAAPAVLCV